MEDNLALFLEKTAKIVEPKIKEVLDSCVDRKTQKLISYQILTGGKRLRPALAIASCQLLGGKVEDVLYPAVGLEISHNYTLIVDDIIDNSTLRRDKPTVWAKFGRAIAECIGVGFAAAIFQAANLSKEPTKISEIFAKTMKTIADGEILDILFEQQGREEEPYVVKNRYLKITEKDYFKMVSKKTAALFQICCEIGGICAEGKEEQIRALRDYGFNLGVAFQIQDDILDIFGEEKAIRQKVGKDITERKGGNIVILFALRELSEIEKEKILKIMRKRKIKSRDIEEAMKLIKKTNSFQKAHRLGKDFVGKAKKNLDLLPKNDWNKILAEIADFTMERKK